MLATCGLLDSAWMASIGFALIVATVATGTSARHATREGRPAVPVYAIRNAPAAPALERLPLRRRRDEGRDHLDVRAARAGRSLHHGRSLRGRPGRRLRDHASAAEGRNGTVKNIRPVVDQTGFDSRTQGERFRAESQAALPITLVPGDSLVSSISVDRIGDTRRWLFNDAETASPVRTVSILTSVAAPQPADAFRPSYAGRNSPIYRSRNLRRQLLPRLRPPRVAPSLAEYERHFRRPWIDSLFFNFDTPVDYMPDYGREIARAVGNAALLLTLNYSGRAEGASARLPHPVRDRPRRPGTRRAIRAGLLMEATAAAESCRSCSQRHCWRTRAWTRQGAFRRRHADDDRTRLDRRECPVCRSRRPRRSRPLRPLRASAASSSGRTRSARTTAAAARAPPGSRKLSPPD